MSKSLKVVMFIMSLSFLAAGCATVNDGLDSTKEAGKEVGKSVGKAMEVPESVATGIGEATGSEEEENPFNR